MLRFYNTMSRKKEEFVSLEKDRVKIYSCGPTVYSYQHIGNMRAAVFVDVLKRILKFSNYEVIDVLNITDVGHLVAEDDRDDSGEDKMLKASRAEQKDPYEIARCYERAYVQDLKRLNVILPKHMPRATEHITEQLKIIQKLEEEGFTYTTSDGVYFDVTQFRKYGNLAKQKLSEKRSGARVKVNTEKRHPHDFALWKFLTGDNKNHIMKWDSKWGLGFPGWHIECSAMSNRYLGEEFDIHTGGIDHIPVHHENEIAQNECSGCVRRVGFWIHNAHLKVDGKKMAKSKGNYYTLIDIIEKGYNPLAFRELCLRTHYRKTLNFTFDSLKAGETNVKKINEFYTKLKSLKPSDSAGDYLEDVYYKSLDKFEKGIQDDMNIPEALSAVYDFMHVVNKRSLLSRGDIARAIEFIERTDTVLGLIDKCQSVVPIDILELARQRQDARMVKDFETADKIRETLRKKGYEVVDSKTSQEGFYIEKIE